MYSGYYGTFIVHVFSLLTSIWSLLTIQSSKTLDYRVQNLLLASVFTVVANSTLSLLRYGLSDGYKLRKLHVVSVNISTIFSFSLIHFALQIAAKLPVVWFYLPVFNIIPFYCNVSKLDYRNKRKRSDGIVILNCLMFLCTAVYLENYFAVAFIISFSFGYIFVRDCGYFLDTEVPSIDIYQYIQCFLCIFLVCSFYE